MKIYQTILCIATALTLSACGGHSNKAEQTTKTMYIDSLDSELLYNGATFQNEGNGVIINLGSNDGYYDLKNLSHNLIKNLKDYSISVCFKVDSVNTLEGYGHFLFAFSKLAENKADEGPYMAMRLNEQRFEVSTGGWNHEEFIMQGGQPQRNVWIHALYRQTGKCGELYLDGQLVGKNENMPILSDIFAEDPACCWIGRAPFAGDKYLTDTEVANFCIFNYAVDDEELNQFLQDKADLK